MNPKQLYPCHLAYLRYSAFCGSKNPIRETHDAKLVTCKRCLKAMTKAGIR